jgi:hypothetical protein
MPIHELLAILTPPLAVSCGPILLLLGARKVWQTLSGDEALSSVPCWAEGSDER